MNESINLIKILKDCPKGFKLYSLVHGEVTFLGISEVSNIYAINVKVDGLGVSYTFDGKIYHHYGGECVLFPSKEMRDWSKFSAYWYKNDNLIKPKFKVGDIIRHKETNKDDVYEISKVYDDSYGIVGFNWGIYMKYQDQYELVPNKFNPKTLQPFDKVLARINKNGFWCCELFSFIEDNTNLIKCCGAYYQYCVPYNDDTKHLLGTHNEAPDFYRYWED